MKVLFVDDDTSLLEQAEIFLEKENKEIDVKTVPSAKKALEMLNDSEYDVIVSDYQMPGMDGLEFLERVREERDSDIPFIIFTGKGREEVAMEALNLGADRYLQKGGDPQSQYEILAEAVVQEVKHKKVEMEKKEVEAELSSVVKGSQDPIYIVDEDCRILFANHAELEAHGKKKGDLIGSRFHDLHSKADSQKFEDNVKKALETGEPQRQEGKYEDEEKFVIRTFTPIENPRTGKIERVSVISKDITERKKAERKLIESEERYRNFFRTSRDCAFITSKDGHWLDMSDSAPEFFGYDSKEELRKVRVSELYENPEERDKLLKTVEEKGFVEDYQVDLRKKEGDIIKTLITFVPVKDKEGQIISYQGTLRDITERKKREKELKRERKKFREIFNNANDAIYLHELTDEGRPGVFVEVNDVACEMLGYSREEFLEMTPRDIDSSKKDDEVPDVMGELLEEGDVRFEMVHQAKDGTEIPVEIHSHLFEMEGEERVLSIARNISGRKKAERREEFLHSLLRHDVRNKAQNTQGYLQLLRKNELSRKQEELIDKAEMEIQGGIEIIEKVRTLRNVEEEMEIEEISLYNFVEDIAKENEVEASEKEMELELDLPDSESKVHGGPLLEELFSNLIGNSVQHSEGSKIRISGKELDGECVVTLEDNGQGIPDDIEEEVFEKGLEGGETGGTGLGLYLVKEIAENYGGSVEVKDSDLGGARFDIHLQKA